ncbi:MAG: DNA-processing protein DprA [Balneolaceae bacterium]
MEKTNHHRAILALLQIPGIRYQRIKILLQQKQVKTAEDIFRMEIPDLMKIDGIGASVAREIVRFDQWDTVDRILDFTRKLNSILVSITDDEYPPLLKHIYDAPPLFWVKGNPKALLNNGIAVVGTRNAGKYGRNQAAYWTKELVRARLNINSGLAYGIDGIAHKTAIDCGGCTIAVLGSGIDWIYPEKHTGLAQQIISSGGAVITEFPPGTKPDAGNFPERNRIVSGMSEGVLVIESGLKGGSMITARFALDQNREVFVVPHQLNHVHGEGNNYLIKSGQGKLVQKPEDIYEEISISVSLNGSVQTKNKNVWKELDIDERGKEICGLLEKGPLHIDSIAEQTNSQTYQLLPKLLELEMLGAIEQRAGKYFQLKEN